MDDSTREKPDGNAASRRGFLKVAGTGLVSLGLLRETHAQTPPTPGETTPATDPPPSPRPWRCTINGEAVEMDLDPRAVLAETLRETLGKTGTKIGCNHGACGACTVHVDGRRVLSCLTLAAAVDGKTVTTIEGLEQNGDLHPMQKAFMACDGYQCGYCTPGQIMSAVACVHEGHADGDEEEVREWMSGNLCRCGAYPNIVDAVKQAAGETKQIPLAKGGR